MRNDPPGVPAMTGLQGFKTKTGTYALILELNADQRLSIGKLGRFQFPSGWYAYAGSALGPGGLAARIRHHWHTAIHPHWHMDYLRPCGRVTEIWYGRRDAVNDEHRWAACLQTLAGTDPVAPGFGSSDCSCDTHLVRFDSRPDIALFRRRLPRAPGQTRSPVYRLPINGLLGVKR